MSITLTQVLIQQGYLTNEQYHNSYQIQQSQPIELRQPLAQIYLEQGFFGIEHVEYCIRLRQQYISEGVEPEFDKTSYEEQQQQYVPEQQQPTSASSGGGATNCKVCLSECQDGWTICPFCGSNL
ncbi:MAG: hypothetical protein H7263_17455 [Candidatus Sericytochromatia bacterium]|nr:hypothetical protein [Candidatus Sericytochromatia bacterium]